MGNLGNFLSSSLASSSTREGTFEQGVVLERNGSDGTNDSSGTRRGPDLAER